MKKLSVAIAIIGAFVLYSFLHAQSNDEGLVPRTLADVSSTATVTPPPTVSGTGGAQTPTPTVVFSNPPATQTAAPAPATVPAQPPTPTTAAGGQFKDGSYTGTVADAQWGNIQVQAVVSQGKISDVQFLQYPHDRSRSVMINRIADPELTSEAVQAQDARVDIISGATDSSEAFIESLTAALAQARA